MLRRYLKLMAFLLSIGFLSSVYSQNTLVELENTQNQAETLDFNSTYTTWLTNNLYKQSSAENQLSQNHILNGRLSLPGKYMISTSLWVTKDYENERKTLVRDSIVSVLKPLGTIFGSINVTGRAGFTLPFSKDSNTTAGLITAARVNPIFSYNASKFIKNLSLIYRPSAVFNVHEFKTRTDLRSNSNYVLSHRLTVAYGITNALWLSLDNTYMRAWTYSGNTNDIYSFDQSLSYNFTRSFSIFGGHSVGGNALDVNGQESDINVFDKDNSSFYMGLSYNF
jgi:hypothetical protein